MNKDYGKKSTQGSRFAFWHMIYRLEIQKGQEIQEMSDKTAWTFLGS